MRGDDDEMFYDEHSRPVPPEVSKTRVTVATIRSVGAKTFVTFTAESSIKVCIPTRADEPLEETKGRAGLLLAVYLKNLFGGQ